MLSHKILARRPSDGPIGGEISLPTPSCADTARTQYPAIGPNSGFEPLKRTIVIGVAAIAAVLLAARELWPHVGDGLLLVLTSGCALLLFGLDARRRGGRGGVTRIGAGLRACGRLSYEIYLGHMFVVFGLLDAFAAIGVDREHGWIVYPLAVVVSWGLGALISRLLTEPADRALRRRLLGAGR